MHLSADDTDRPGLVSMRHWIDGFLTRAFFRRRQRDGDREAGRARARTTLESALSQTVIFVLFVLVLLTEGAAGGAAKRTRRADAAIVKPALREEIYSNRGGLIVHDVSDRGCSLVVRLKGGSGSSASQKESFAPKAPNRSKSQLWFQGYMAGQVQSQFLQSYEPHTKDESSLVIGLAGGTGSGKTTIKEVIMQQLQHDGAIGEERGDNVAVLSHDNYYKHHPEMSDEERDKINFDHPDSLDTALMVEHLKELLAGRAVECPIYDFATHLRRQNETIRVEPRPIIIVEGILIFCDQVFSNQTFCEQGHQQTDTDSS